MTKDVPQLPEDFRRDIGPLLDARTVTEKQGMIDSFKTLAPWLAGVFLIFVLLFNFAGSKLMFGLKKVDLLTSIQKNENDDKYGEAMEWANKNIPAGERIFNCNWDDFPKLFYFDQKHSYIYGLDPNYLYRQNPELYKLVKQITDGKHDDPAPVIKEQFGSNWVFSDSRECEDFLAKLLESGWAETVHEDGESYILKLRATKGLPPKETDDVSPAEALEAGKDNAGERNTDNKNANALPEDEQLEEEDPDEDELYDEDDIPPEDEEDIPRRDAVDDSDSSQ
jgi:hypothetical protein